MHCQTHAPSHHSRPARRFASATSAGSSLASRRASTRASSRCAATIGRIATPARRFFCRVKSSSRSPPTARRGESRPPKWRHLARDDSHRGSPTWPSLRTGLRARISLLPFQLEPALAVTHGIASRLLLADEVGLGKTIQAALIVAEILERTRHARVLIVAPASLKEQWQSELNNRFRSRHGLPTLWLWRASVRSGAPNPWTCRPVRLRQSTSSSVQRSCVRSRHWCGTRWCSTRRMGSTGRSDRALAAGALARRARTVVLLTATPHAGDDRAFDTLCGIGDLDRAFPLLTFRRTRSDVGLAVSRRRCRCACVRRLPNARCIARFRHTCARCAASGDTAAMQPISQ